MIEKILQAKAVEAVKALYKKEIEEKVIGIQKTRHEFDGDLTIVVFLLLRFSKKSPEQTAQEIGQYLVDNLKEVSRFNVIKGFLNLIIDDTFWISFFKNNYLDENYGLSEKMEDNKIVVEYSSPNTNKPLHLGHIRNNLIGYSVANILQANGRNVIKANLVNDRGIHICKSMLAWLKWGNGETPESSGMKGDHLIGKYYVMFEQFYKAEIMNLVEQGKEKEIAEKEAPLMIEAQEMLRKWETGDEKIRSLWKKMNEWVYQGFDETYRKLGVDFDKIYYESDTYLLGKELIEKGLKNKILFRKNDGSVWCDLTNEGLDEKLLLRADGTSVYITQDIGTAKLRYDEYDPEKLIYVVGNEQNYHFDVLKIILKKLGEAWADNIVHLSYGMVELPHGRMKSREGKVIDADDLMDEMYGTAKETTEELGKIEKFSEKEKGKLFRMISLGALKYFILKVDPKKTMLFNPKESIDFNGNTGPFIQYTNARIRSLFRKADEIGVNTKSFGFPKKLIKKEKELLKILNFFPTVIKEAGDNYSPALIANYVYELAREFNQFYQEIPILKPENKSLAPFRLMLAGFCGNVIKLAMRMLGIDVPERM